MFVSMKTDLYRRNVDEFNRIAREHTQRHAMSSSSRPDPVPAFVAKETAIDSKSADRKRSADDLIVDEQASSSCSSYEPSSGDEEEDGVVSINKRTGADIESSGFNKRCRKDDI